MNYYGYLLRPDLTPHTLSPPAPAKHLRGPEKRSRESQARSHGDQDQLNRTSPLPGAGARRPRHGWAPACSGEADRAGHQRRGVHGHMEPPVGIEPTSFSLRVGTTPPHTASTSTNTHGDRRNTYRECRTPSGTDWWCWSDVRNRPTH